MPVNAGVVGIDEAGRGAWAGPLVAAAVTLGPPIAGLNDSKLLNRARREYLAEQIRRQAVFAGIGVCEPADIDRLGLSRATSLAMGRAIIGLPARVHLIIDGPINYLPDQRSVKTLINADAIQPEVMAASILAKVERDRLMREYAKTWPAYGFEYHVGYGTARHRQAIKDHGACQLHRLSFKPLQAHGASS